MVAELRNMGDKLALYTDDNRLYRQLSKRSYALYGVPYTRAGKMVAVDLYLDRKARGTIKRVLSGQMLLDI